MNKETWSWERWCSFLRGIARKETEAEVRLVQGLMELELRREVWEGRGVGFAKLISHPAHLALPISATRYERIKDAIERYGDDLVRRLGVPVADCVARLKSDANRTEFLEQAGVWVTEYGRPMSAQAAYKLLTHIAPSESSNPRKTATQRLREAQERIAELEKLLEEKEAALGRAVADLRRAKTLLRRHGIGF